MIEENYTSNKIDKTVKLEQSNVKTFVGNIYSLRLIANNKNYWHHFTVKIIIYYLKNINQNSMIKIGF